MPIHLHRPVTRLLCIFARRALPKEATLPATRCHTYRTYAMRPFDQGASTRVTSVGNSSISLVLPVIVLHVVRLGTSHYRTLSALCMHETRPGNRVGADVDMDPYYCY